MTLPDLTVDGVFDAAVCTFDGLNYLTPDELRLTLAAVAHRLRPAGWLVFDLHTDAMMGFTIANPVVAGESAGNDFVISSVVDPGARTCDTTIELTRPRDGDPFSEQHRSTSTRIRTSVRPSRRGLRGDRDRRGVHPRTGRRLDPARDLDRTAYSDVIAYGPVREWPTPNRQRTPAPPSSRGPATRPRMRLEPGGVAVGQRRRRETMSEDRQSDRT